MKTFKKLILASLCIFSLGAFTPVKCQDSITKEGYKFIAQIVSGVAWYLRPAIKKMCIKAKDIEWKKVVAAMQKMASQATKK